MFGRRTQSAQPAPAAPSEADAIIRAVDVSRTYDTGIMQVPALIDVNFSAAKGEMVAVMGPSGCGKTTLLHCLSGLDGVDSGQIWIEGKDIATLSDRERTAYRASRMGFIFQVYNLLPVLTALENVELPLLVGGVRPKLAHSKAMDALDAVGLGDWQHHRPAELSGGQRQRVTVARALVNDPAIIWADEPTGALDSKAAAEIVDLMRDMNRRLGLTIVLVTHDADVGAVCDRIVHMSDGRIVGEAVVGPRLKVVA
ncbi:MAG: ABC transporter ATP-binding protein [Thermomicrobiales bacterium]|nr:ABC transporter ATP-binding protein [Thermomicrobiales bacterium]